jgi:long-subunit acyl-CoA synthetase (AMP-forming)/pimeloyl-ACP methyl ester carboxylesterase
MTASQTLPAYLADAITHFPDAVLFRRPTGRAITYGEVGRWATGAAARLADIGLGPGSFVVTYLDDTVETAIFDLACSLAGVIPAPLSPAFSVDYLRRMCAQLGTSDVLTRPELAAGVAGAGLRPALISFPGDQSHAGYFLDDPGVSLDDALDWAMAAAGRTRPDATLILQATSGSTGTPKLVRRSHRAVARYAHFVGALLADLHERPRFLAVNRLTHAFGLHIFVTAVSLSAELSVPTRLDTAASLEEVRALDPNVLPMTPRVLRSLFAQSTTGATQHTGPEFAHRIFGPSARFLFSAGGKSDPGLLGAVAAAGIEVVEWYGSSEASLVALTPRGGWRPGYAGRVVDDTLVRVAADGELLVRSPGLMDGYYGDAAATTEVITTDGFYCTGDIGEVSSDGYLRILGRKRDVFNTPEGSNIHPGRIETMLEALGPVDQAMLVGDQRPYLVAFLVLRDDVAAGTRVGCSDDGVIEPASAPTLYAEMSERLAKLNRSLEAIEQVRRFLLLATCFPDRLYELVGPAKVRRNRSAFAEVYADRISQLYTGDGVGHISEPETPGPSKSRPTLRATRRRVLNELPVVLVPGLISTARAWAAQIEALGVKRTVVIADQTGHDSIDAIADEVLANAPPRFALAGHSMGGYVALEIVRQASHRVDRLALLGTTARADTVDAGIRRIELMRLAVEQDMASIADLLLPLMIPSVRLDDRQLIATVRQMAEATGSDAFIREQAAITTRVDQRSMLTGIRCPSVVVVGEHDALTSSELAREMHESIRHSDLVVVPGCGHLPTLEAPETVNEVLHQWLATEAGHDHEEDHHHDSLHPLRR